MEKENKNPNNLTYPPEVKSGHDRKLFRMGWEARIRFLVSRAGPTMSAKRLHAASLNGAKGGRPKGGKNKPGHRAGRPGPQGTITITRSQLGPNDNGIC